MTIRHCEGGRGSLQRQLLSVAYSRTFDSWENCVLSLACFFPPRYRLYHSRQLVLEHYQKLILLAQAKWKKNASSKIETKAKCEYATFWMLWLDANFSKPLRRRPKQNINESKISCDSVCLSRCSLCWRSGYRRDDFTLPSSASTCKVNLSTHLLHTNTHTHSSGFYHLTKIYFTSRVCRICVYNENDAPANSAYGNTRINNSVFPCIFGNGPPLLLLLLVQFNLFFVYFLWHLLVYFPFSTSQVRTGSGTQSNWMLSYGFDRVF